MSYYNQEVDRINDLEQDLEQAEQTCRDRIKADRLYCLKHGDEFAQDMAQRLEQAEARVADLEKVVDDGSDAWLLRKQAEAVSDFGQPFDRMHRMVDSRAVHEDAEDYAQRLRQQADELENTQ